MTQETPMIPPPNTKASMLWHVVAAALFGTGVYAIVLGDTFALVGFAIALLLWFRLRTAAVRVAMVRWVAACLFLERQQAAAAPKQLAAPTEGDQR